MSSLARSPSGVRASRERLTDHALVVQRSGIRFHNVALDRVAIEIEVENRGPDRSRPTTLRLESAPFGVFLPWRFLRILPVPSIEPGASAVVTTVARQPRPGADPVLAGLARQLPRGLGSGLAPSATLQRLLAGLGSVLASGQRARELPPDLLELLDGPRPHWAGNLDVWIGSRPVERHRAPRLRLHAGQANLAVFCVGQRADEYDFLFERPEGWKHALLCDAGELTHRCAPWEELQWNRLGGLSGCLCVLRPPADAAAGRVAVHVTQRSSGKSASVEFDLDPEAQGPGCFRL